MEYNNSKNKDKVKEMDKFGLDYEKERPNYLIEAFKWSLVVIVAIFIALILRAYVFEWVVVEGPSMENTLYSRQVLFVNKIVYTFVPPKRGDIIVFKVSEGNLDYIPIAKNIPVLSSLIPPKNEIDYIKRVIGLPGDEIDIIDGYVYINGNKQKESYVKGSTVKQSFELPCVVPENKVFVMGDNREVSKDSRQFGFVDMEKIKGKAVFRIRPLKEFGSIYD
ncbi:signal peptidase I [Acetivibrio clariflavus]|uniref:signal peptidase I n=1 Tax=Acetivibrio clariflavus TaxID=288965 RepID=UPI0031F570D5